MHTGSFSYNCLLGLSTRSAEASPAGRRTSFEEGARVGTPSFKQGSRFWHGHMEAFTILRLPLPPAAPPRLVLMFLHLAAFYNRCVLFLKILCCGASSTSALRNFGVVFWMQPLSAGLSQHICPLAAPESRSPRDLPSNPLGAWKGNTEALREEL